MTSLTIYTVGHSTRSLGELVRLLKENGIQTVIDVRTVPRSRHNPQFNRECLSTELERSGIKYQHIPELGGFRRPQSNSPNAGWRNAGFRGFADYMGTPQFEEGLVQCIATAQKTRSAIMCSEAVPRRCHRSLIADALTVRGYEVLNIFGVASLKLHKLTPWASIHGIRLTYPAQGMVPGGTMRGRKARESAGMRQGPSNRNVSAASITPLANYLLR